MLHFSVLQNTLGAEHDSAVFAIELDFLGRMDLTKLDGRDLLLVWPTFLGG